MVEDPIQQIIRVSGEDAVIKTPTAAKSADYDPTQAQNFTPGAPVTANVRGVIAGKTIMSGLPQGANSAFIISATSKPAGLTAGQSRLDWGKDWLIVDYRERRWLGNLNGYTLFLQG